MQFRWNLLCHSLPFLYRPSLHVDNHPHLYRKILMMNCQNYFYQPSSVISPVASLIVETSGILEVPAPSVQEMYNLWTPSRFTCIHPCLYHSFHSHPDPLCPSHPLSGKCAQSWSSILGGNRKNKVIKYKKYEMKEKNEIFNQLHSVIIWFLHQNTFTFSNRFPFAAAADFSSHCVSFNNLIWNISIRISIL